MYPLFELLYNRKAVLLIEVKYNAKDLQNLDASFDKDKLESATFLRNQIHHKVENNFKKTQKN